MAGSGATTFEWGNGTYTFRLDIGDLRELQDNPNVGVGPIALFNRIGNDTWLADDIPEVIRLGLIRGGNGRVTPTQAINLVKRYYHEANKVDGKRAAIKILHAYLMWPEDDPVGGAKAEGNVQPDQSAPNSPSPPSTESVGA